MNGKWKNLKKKGREKEGERERESERETHKFYAKCGIENETKFWYEKDRK